MTEQEWMACDDPKPMLAFLRDKTGERKLRLFALACCDRIDRLITDERSRQALEFTQAHVERGVNRRKGRAAVNRAGRAAHKEAYGKMFSGEERAKGLIVSNALDAAVQTLNADPFCAATYAASFACYALAWEVQVLSRIDPYPELRESSKRPEQTYQASLVREIFGNPFRPIALDGAWLAWNAGTIRKVAQSIYDERAWDQLPVLADALEDAGCNDATILAHLRGPGPHVRGCWALDLILGRQ